MNNPSYKDFHKKVFMKNEGYLADNTLVVDRSDYLQLGRLWGKEFNGYGQLNKQNTLIITESPLYWKNNISKTLKKEGKDFALDHSKKVKEADFVTVVDFNSIEGEDKIEGAIEEITDFHDNGLESQEDNRLFRLYIDSPALLDTTFLHNLKVYTRKTNITFTMSVNITDNDFDLDEFFIYFDKVFEIDEIKENLQKTLGTVKVLKSQDIDSFTASETMGLSEGRGFFIGLEKHHNINFRDIDVTDIL